MSHLRSTHPNLDRVIAISASDLHLSHKAPTARTLNNWMHCQKKQLQELSSLVDKYQVPLFLVGDIFDKPTHHAEIVNLALRYLPHAYGVPGNHELPYHNLKEVKKSSFWTLVEAGLLTYVEPGKPYQIEGYTPIVLHGFPYGVEVSPLEHRTNLAIEIALIHSFIWQRGKGHVGADEAAKVEGWKGKLQGYDVALFGDNHLPFDTKVSDCVVVNHGSFFRRYHHEINHRPSVVLIYGDLHTERYYLDTSQDEFTEERKVVSSILELDTGELLQELQELGDDKLDFRQVVFQAIDNHKVKQEVKDCVLEAMGEVP